VLQNTEEKLESLRQIVPDVSRETFQRLLCYEALLREHVSRTNLISLSTVESMWERHFLDAAQLFPLLKDHKASLVDIGSGAGFPGMVLAILGMEDVVLVEATRKKCDFLEIVSRETKTEAAVVWGRIEHLKDTFDVVTARAVAPLSSLFQYVAPLLKPHGLGLLLKGEKTLEEISEAQKKWTFTYNLKESKTHSKGFVISVRDLQKK